MERRENLSAKTKIEALKGSIRHLMRTDPKLIHIAYGLEARIGLAEVLGKQDELSQLLIAYSELSKNAAKILADRGNL